MNATEAAAAAKAASGGQVQRQPMGGGASGGLGVGGILQKSAAQVELCPKSQGLGPSYTLPHIHNLVYLSWYTVHNDCVEA